MNVSYYEPQSHSAQGTPAYSLILGIEAACILISLFIGLSRNLKAKYRLGLLTLVLECLTTFYFISSIDNDHQSLRNANPLCNILLDTKAIKLEGYLKTNNTNDTMVVYEMSGCNFFVVCDYLEEDRCSVGNAIMSTEIENDNDSEAGYHTNVTLVQNDWLKSSVCPDIDDYFYNDPFFGRNHRTFGIIDKPSSWVFDIVLTWFFQGMLYMLAISYYMYAFYIEKFNYKNNKSKELKRDSGFTETERKFWLEEEEGEDSKMAFLLFVWEQFVKLYMLPITILNVLPDRELGCDHIITRAESLGWGCVVGVIIVIMYFSPIVLMDFYHAFDKEKSRPIFFMFGVLIVLMVGTQVVLMWSRLTFAYSLTLFVASVDLSVLSMRLNLPDVTSVAFFSFQMGRMTRFTQKLVSSVIGLYLTPTVSGRSDVVFRHDDGCDESERF